jgi:hypothetical protein
MYAVFLNWQHLTVGILEKIQLQLIYYNQTLFTYM